MTLAEAAKLAMKASDPDWVPTPAQTFVRDWQKAGGNFPHAVFELFLSDIPLEEWDRAWLAFMWAFACRTKPRAYLASAQNRMITAFQAEMRKLRRADLRKKGIIGEAAEAMLADMEGIKIGALRKRTTRANQRRQRRAKRRK
jgi:hypothetical protein